MKQLVWLTALLCALFRPSVALAFDEDEARSRFEFPRWQRALMPLRLGMVASATMSGEGTLGLEASAPLDVIEKKKDEFLPIHVFGPVFQWQRLHKHDRVMLGLEWAGWPVLPIPVGLEAGWAYWETDRGPVQGIHLTPFLSAALISIGPRFFVPVTAGGDTQIALNVYLKYAPFYDGLGLFSD